MSGSGHLRRRWLVSGTVGLFIGLGVPAVVGARLTGANPGMVAGAVIAAAAIGGVILGLCQGWVLASALPDLRLRWWVAVTGLAVVMTWVVALIPMLWGPVISRWPAGAQTPAVAATGLALVFTVGILQWRVLRRCCRHAGLWIWANATGWVLGFTVLALLVTPFVHGRQTWTETVVVGVVGGFVVAVIVTAVCGAFLVRILRMPGNTGAGRRPQPGRLPGTVRAIRARHRFERGVTRGDLRP